MDEAPRKLMAVTVASPAYAERPFPEGALLKFKFNDGSIEYISPDANALEYLLVQLGVWSPQIREGNGLLLAVPHPDCAACASCHHTGATFEEATRALGLRHSTLPFVLTALTSEFAWSELVADVEALAPRGWRPWIRKWLSGGAVSAQAVQLIGAVRSHNRGVQLYELPVPANLRQIPWVPKRRATRS